MNVYVLDEREKWVDPVLTTARRRGYEAKEIKCGAEVREGGGIGFIRPHADPKRLLANRDDYALMAEHLTMIQDWTQVELYEDKSAQFWRWREWMPDTWRFSTKGEALGFVERSEYPLVSKADVGASSRNVRILNSKAEAAAHVHEVFGKGIEVDHCSGGAKSKQRGYVLLQRFIPHSVTWRVNAIGRTRAIFRRFNYPDRPVAQTGNVEPVMTLSEETESLLAYANQFFAHAGTQWCAIDVLRDGDQWRFLESSCSWPWPSPGLCNEAPLFGSERRWIEMFDVMFDELEAGAWQQKN